MVAPTPPADAKRPAAVREVTLRACAVAALVAVVMGAAYPYVVLRLGFGPNVSIVAAFLGYLGLRLAFRAPNRWENNIVQTAGTSAAQTAFLCVVLAAFDMLRTSTVVDFTFAPTPLQSFLWLTSTGVLGVLLAVPLRRHFVVEEKLTYADGVAAAATLVALDARGPEARAAVRALLVGAVASGTVLFLQLPTARTATGLDWLRLPELVAPTLFGLALPGMGTGLQTSLLNVGTGMIVGFRVAASLLVGTLAAYVVAPDLLRAAGELPASPTRSDVLAWVMWPATGMIVAGGLTSLVVRWRLVVATFRSFTTGRGDATELPLRWVAIGGVSAAVAVVWIQRELLGVPVWMTLVAIALSLPLMLVGLRVLGETNWAPISALSNLMQAVFAAIAPGNVLANLTASGTTGTIAVSSESIMQDYKTGHLIGSTPRVLTIAQLAAIPVGAAAVSLIYPILTRTYGPPGQGVLHSPTAAKFKGFAELLLGGLSALPRAALVALVVAAAVGVVLTLLEHRGSRWVPSPTALGMGMLIPAGAVAGMFVGAVASRLWRRSSPDTAEALEVPLAAGLVAGEALVAVVVPLLLFAGIARFF